MSDMDAVTVIVRKLPEGVFLGTSEDLPGLIVEAESRNEVIRTARHMAEELMTMMGLKPSPPVVFELAD